MERRSAPVKASAAKQERIPQDRKPDTGDQEVDERVKERTWNAGVGPRPGKNCMLPIVVALEIHTSLHRSCDENAVHASRRKAGQASVGVG